jgi:hypothetical protein
MLNHSNRERPRIIRATGRYSIADYGFRIADFKFFGFCVAPLGQAFADKTAARIIHKYSPQRPRERKDRTENNAPFSNPSFQESLEDGISGTIPV